jgi:hypothetical protein
MSIILGFNVTDFSIRILQSLFIHRGMTAKQLTQVLNPSTLPSISQEKSILNYLRKLKKQKLVVSVRLQRDFSYGSIYYLTDRGDELIKHWLNICKGQQGEGWVMADNPLFGDIPYPISRPPLDQTLHHLALIDFFIELNKHTDLGLDYRLNLYASKNYYVNGEKFRFRPDGEIKLMDGRRIAVEIDRGTENHEQLRRKFKVYRQYLDYVYDSKSETPPVAILFVLEDKQRQHGIKRRWANIATAFLAEIGPYHDKVNLIMTSLTKTKETLHFEINRDYYGKLSYENLLNNLNGGLHELYGFLDKKNRFSIIIAINRKAKKYFVIFCTISQTYETFIYSRLSIFLNSILNLAKLQNLVKNLEFVNNLEGVFYKEEIPFILKGKEYDLVNWEYVFEEIKEKACFYKLNPDDLKGEN